MNESLFIWTLGQIFGVALLVFLVLGIRVLVDALVMFHRTRMRRVRR